MDYAQSLLRRSSARLRPFNELSEASVGLGEESSQVVLGCSNGVVVVLSAYSSPFGAEKIKNTTKKAGI